MRKLLSILTATTLSTTISISSIGARCSNAPVNEEKNPPTKPITPIIHDIAYYQTEITSLTKQVTQIQQDINDINSKESKHQVCDANIICQDLQQLMDSNTAELKQYQAQIQNYYYQILLINTELAKLIPPKECDKQC